MCPPFWFTRELLLHGVRKGEEDFVVHWNGARENGRRGCAGNTNSLGGTRDSRASGLALQGLGVSRHHGETGGCGCARRHGTKAGITDKNLAVAAVWRASVGRIFGRRNREKRHETSRRTERWQEVIVAGKPSGLVGGNKCSLRRAGTGGSS